MSCVVYSPLCDADKDLYLAYLFAVGSHGSAHDVFGGRHGSAGGARCDRGGYNDAVGFGMDDAFCRIACGTDFVVGRAGHRCDVRVESVVDCGSEGARERGAESGGISGDNVVGGVSGVCDSVADDRVSGKVERGSDDASVDGRSVGRQPGSEEALEVSPVRGKHYERNRRRKLAHRNRRLQQTDFVEKVHHSVRADARLKSHANDRGYFSACSDEVKDQLRTSRAEMLILKNKEQAVRSRLVVERDHLEKVTRVGEARYELERLSVEEKLRKISEARLGVGRGSEADMTSSPPSLSSGSVSPSSSISVAEERRLRVAVASGYREVDELKKEVDRLKVSLRESCDEDSFGGGGVFHRW